LYTHLHSTTLMVTSEAGTKLHVRFCAKASNSFANASNELLLTLEHRLWERIIGT
jgi:hypothetical protein